MKHRSKPRGWWSAILIALLAKGNSALAENQPEAVDLLKKANAAHSSDWAKLRRSKGSGQIVWMHPDGNWSWICDTDFEVYDDLFWMEMKRVSSGQDEAMPTSRIEIVADGTTIANVNDSDSYKPSGCQVYVREDIDKTFYLASGGCRLDPRKLISPYYLRGDPVPSLIESGEISIEQRSDETMEIHVKFGSSSYKYWLSPKWNFRISRFELWTMNDVPDRTYEYEWKSNGDDVVPASITLRVRDAWNRSNLFHTYVMTLDELSSLTNAPREFSVTSLKTCDGARLLDQRPDVDPVRTITEVATAESIKDEVQAMPIRDRSPPKRVTPAPAPSSGWMSWLVWVNVAMVVLVLSLWGSRLLRGHAKE